MRLADHEFVEDQLDPGFCGVPVEGEPEGVCHSLESEHPLGEEFYQEGPYHFGEMERTASAPNPDGAP